MEKASPAEIGPVEVGGWLLGDRTPPKGVHPNALPRLSSSARRHHTLSA
jgi:hypothetical protein